MDDIYVFSRRSGGYACTLVARVELFYEISGGLQKVLPKSIIRGQKKNRVRFYLKAYFRNCLSTGHMHGGGGGGESPVATFYLRIFFSKGR